MKRFIIRMAILLASSSAIADDGGYYAIGAGIDSCGKMLNNHRNDSIATEQIYGAWVVGFVSGSNSVCSKQVPIDYYAATAFLMKFCSENPLKTVVQASHQLREEMGGPSQTKDCR